jgi:tetratricopeptide (TPR) repeat protein
MLLAHPEAEDLGRFVEGTLDDPQRAAIVHHIADCDDCRMTIVDAAEFESQSAVETHKWGVARWLATAAAVAFVVSLGSFSNHEYRENAAGREIHLVDDAPRFVMDAIRTSIREWGGLRELPLGWLVNRLDPAFAFTDPLAPVEEAYGHVNNRPLEARISGFPYVRRTTMRGSEDNDTDPAAMILKSKASELTDLSGSGAKTLHAHGIGLLLADDDPKKSIADLQAAAERDPHNTKYQSDLAAALIAASRGDRMMLENALAACDRALRIDPNSPDALFNRAVALQDLERPDEAIAAYEGYLKVDRTSSWASEVRGHIETLRPPR